MTRTAAVFLAALLASETGGLRPTLANAGEWPQWLGPDRDGSSPEKIPAWTGPPKVVWRAAVGEGHASPVVARGRLYLHTRPPGQDVEEVRAYDAATGKVVWEANYPRAAFESQFGHGPRATPAVAGGRLYTFGVTGVLSCFDAAKGGEPVWRVDVLKEFGAKNLFFGMSASPLVYGKLVIVPVGAAGAGLVAFDKDTAKVVWKALDDPASYSSPVVIDAAGRKQLVALTQLGLNGLNPDDGAKLWSHPFKDALFESSTTPVLARGLLVGSSVTLGSVALKLSAKDGGVAIEPAWKKPTLSCYFSTPVAVGPDHLYMVTGSVIPPPQVVLRCVETATGKEVWSRQKVGRYHAALLRLGDGKLLLHSDDGSLALLAPDTAAYKELARSKVCGPTWAHPALAGGRLYLRDEKELLCLEP